ncbi:MAG: class I SAM-dependent methyltransferase [Flavobacteriales bacterium]|nr:class I SAM-dependent methyltransferase [Flavobacteriales bacterium]
MIPVLNMNMTTPKALRSRLFTHLEGIPLIASVLALHDHDVFDIFKQQDCVSIKNLAARLDANEGYLNVSFRLMASQGWMHREFKHDSPHYCMTAKGRKALRNLEVWNGLEDWIRVTKDLRHFTLEELGGLDGDMLCRHISSLTLHEATISIDDVEQQMLAHKEGLICGVLLVNLGMKGLLDTPELHLPEEWGAVGLDGATYALWEHLGWIFPTAQSYRFTELGDFYRKRAAAYGVTVSYLQTFSWLPKLLFGAGDQLWNKPADVVDEIHVDRTMNVWGSGGAHGTYFNKIDEVVIEIFNQPLDQQPRGICDMGCGNGALLEHLYDVVKNHTLRGEHLDDHPLLVVGADFNNAALVATAETLGAAGLDFHCVHGDIGDPAELAHTLRSEFDVELANMLNVRSFLDHNRIFVEPKGNFSQREPLGTGAYAFRGRRVSCAEVEQNLLEHLSSWKPYIEKYGLLVIELHTIRPSVASENLGRTSITAYDGTHGYTDQYIVELDVFQAIAEEAGLHSVERFRSRFPDSDLATVSIHLLRGK